MKLGAIVGMRGDPDRFARHVQQLEASGVEYLWAGEAYSADAVSTLGFLAAVTRKAQIGSSILPLYTRTPTLLAMTAVGVDRLSQGRFNLGLGASGPQVIEGFHGVPYDKPLARTREIVEICRKVWQRERVRHDGPLYRLPLPEGPGTGLGKELKLVNHPVRMRIPVYVAALGVKNVEMTAEIAEGWLPLHFWPDKAKDIYAGPLAAGRERRSPEMPPLEIAVGGPLAIGPDVAHLRDLARPALALYFGGMGARGQNYYNKLLRAYGFEKEAAEIQDLYLSGHKKEAAAKVPGRLLDGMSLIGEEGFVRDRLAAYAEAGVTILNVQPVGPEGLKDVEKVASWLA